jgi:hypothetical protein
MRWAELRWLVTDGSPDQQEDLDHVRGISDDSLSAVGYLLFLLICLMRILMDCIVGCLSVLDGLSVADLDEWRWMEAGFLFGL